jgi:hypothetical protein
VTPEETPHSTQNTDRVKLRAQHASERNCCGGPAAENSTSNMPVVEAPQGMLEGRWPGRAVADSRQPERKGVYWER